MQDVDAGRFAAALWLDGTWWHLVQCLRLAALFFLVIDISVL